MESTMLYRWETIKYMKHFNLCSVDFCLVTCHCLLHDNITWCDTYLNKHSFPKSRKSSTYCSFEAIALIIIWVILTLDFSSWGFKTLSWLHRDLNSWELDNKSCISRFTGNFQNSHLYVDLPFPLHYHLFHTN